MDMDSVIWAQELQGAIKKVTSVIEKLAVEKDEDAQNNRQNLQTVSQQIRSALQRLWMGDDGLFEIRYVICHRRTNNADRSSDPKQGAAAAQASIAVSRGRTLQAAFDPILHALISVMDTPNVALRSKALRGLGSIVTVDPELLGLVSRQMWSMLTSSLQFAKVLRTDFPIARPPFGMRLSS